MPYYKIVCEQGVNSDSGHSVDSEAYLLCKEEVLVLLLFVVELIEASLLAVAHAHITHSCVT